MKPILFYYIRTGSPAGFKSLIYAIIATLFILLGSSQGQASIALVDIGGTAPTPGANDISQLSATGNTGNPNSKNYYSNNNPPPGEKFTTGWNTGGYTMTDIYLEVNNGNGNGIGSSTPWTLYIYSVSGSTATLLTSFSGLTTGASLNNGDWLHFSGFSIPLAANTSYAYAISSGSSAYTGLANSTTTLSGANALLIPTGGGTVTTVTGFNGVFDIALTQGTTGSVTEQGGAPTPGANDVSQLSTTGNTSNPNGKNYFSNGNSSSVPLPPGEEFTTPNGNPGGYTLTNLSVQTGNGSGNGIGALTPWTLYIYSVSGGTATLINSYSGILGTSFTASGWICFNNLSVNLLANTTYAYALSTSASGSGPYTGLENSTTALTGANAVLINTGSGAMTTVTGFNGVFDAGLSPIAAPGPPVGLTATPGNNQVTLNWTASGGTVTGYNVYRSTASGSGFTVLPAGANVSSSPFTDSTAVNGTTYYYVVTALNGSSESSRSSQVSATPPRANETVFWNGIQTSDNNWTLSITEGNWLGTGTTFFENQDAVVFNDNSSSGPQSVNLNVPVIPGSLVFVNTNVSYTVSGSGEINGTTGLINNGPGTVTLTETGGDNFTGGVTVNGGTLILDDANAAIAGGAVISGAGTLQIGNNDGNGSLPLGNVTNNSTLVFNRSDTGLIVGNAIFGSGSVVQGGSGSIVQLSGNSSFTGPVLVTNSSTLRVGSTFSLGTTAGNTVIANGSTLDLDFGGVLAEPIFAQGVGVDGSGGIVNNLSGGDPTLTAIILTGDTTIGGVNRWDVGGLSTAGSAYNLTVAGGAYHELSNASVDTNLANITITGSGTTLGDKGTTTLGNPTNILEIQTGAFLEFWNNGGANVTLNKQLLIDSGGTLQNGSGASQIVGPVNLAPGVCYFNIGAPSLMLNGALEGSGILDLLNTSTGTFVINGDASSFTGSAYIYGGEMVVNGNFGSGITCEQGGILAGNGSISGLADIYGTLLPGTAGVAGTFNAVGGLTLETGAALTNDLSSTINGSNDLLVVTGNLSVNGNTIIINPLNGTLQNGVYPLIKYSGNLSGAFGGIQTASPSIYTLTLTNITSVTPNEIAVIVSGTSSSLYWNNASGNNQWDVLGSFNWTNFADHAEEQFASADIVTFDDSITNAVVPGTNIIITSGETVAPVTITNNSTVNYTISGAGSIGGAANIFKMGSSTLSITTTNSFTGSVTISGGTLQAWGPGGLGTTNGIVTITNGATLDRGWSGVGPIIVSGSGAGGNGAIVNNSSGNAIYDGAGGMTPGLILAGDTTFGGNTRWDLGNASGATVSCLGGSNYNIAVNETSGTYMEWDNLTIDTNLGNIDIYTTGGGSLGIKGSGLSLGNPTNIITVHTNSILTFWGETTNNSGYAKVIHVLTNGLVQFRPQSPNVYYNSTLILDGGSALNLFNGSGSNGTVLMAPVTLNGLVHIVIGDSACTVSNVIGGPGGFYFDNNNNNLVFAAANTYQGITDIRSGMSLALAGNGSIANSTLISLTGGATIITSNRVDGTLTLASSQVLQGNGNINGNLVAGSGSAISPGTNLTVGALSISQNVTLNGSALFKLNSTVSDQLSAGNALTYGGTLVLTNISGNPLAVGNSFKLFNAAGYSGAFASIIPATPGAGLAWNTNNLSINGTLSVVSSTSGVTITGIQVNGITLTLTAANGADNEPFVLLGSTNLLLPISQWTPILTNTFDGNGNLSLSTNIINPNTAQEFYLLQMP